MRNRTADSSTPTLPPTGQTTLPGPQAEGDEGSESADSMVWVITDKGLRASGAASMRSTATGLRRFAGDLVKAARRLDQDVLLRPSGTGESAPSLRRATITYRRCKGDELLPELRLGGKWLRRAGFDLGQKVQVKVDAGRLTIYAE